jgi:acyl-CoA synthetase (AMP-forming)/AMP-acid ligase II
MANSSLVLTESASRYPDAAALRCADVTTTYSMLADDVARFADYLIDGGLEPGDRVGVMLPNNPPSRWCSMEYCAQAGLWCR